MTHPLRHLLRAALRAALAAGTAAGLGLAVPAHAQLGVPRVTLPTLPRELPRLPSTPPPEATQALAPLQTLRRNAVRELLRNHADVLEADPAGEPVRRRELLLAGPTQATLDAARALGFVVLREQVLQELELRQVVLLAPPGMATAAALARLRSLDPQLDVDFNHLYTRSGEAAGAAAPASSGGAGDTNGALRRVGLVDSGLDRHHAALRAAELHTWGCGDVPVSSAHGTAVASLLVGRDASFAGVLPGSALYAADIYCGQPTGGAAEEIASALAWLAREKVAVINISLVGPANRLLERAVQAMNRKGHLIVAAVGNDGPAAPPLYPASYPGVVGVTGVNTTRRALPEAAQGPQVMFAAPGAEMAVARPGGGYVAARGTSFAAPLVAGMLAEGLRRPDGAAAATMLARMAGSAQDLGAPGRDPVFGIGLVAEQVRVPPARVQASAH